MALGHSERSILAGRYARAFFDLATEQKLLAKIEKDVETLHAVWAESGDFVKFAMNPLLSRNAKADAVAALAKKLKLQTLTGQFLAVMAKNRRLGLLVDVLKAFDVLLADAKGVLRAEVVSAVKLKKAQLDAVEKNIKDAMGRDVLLEARVDPNVLGGLRVKVGSVLFDGSVAYRLERLQLALRQGTSEAA